MTKKGTDIVCYITIVGWLISFFCGTREQSKVHLNQSLVLFIAGVAMNIIGNVLMFIPILGWIAIVAINVGTFVLWIMGLVRAISGDETPIPIAGTIRIIE